MSIASNSTVIILGSTGSIGTQGLDVISRHPERFTVTGLAAGGAHIELLAQQAAQFHVSEVAVFDETKVPALQAALAQAGAQGVRVTGGPDSVIAMAGSGANVVLNGITGSIGLEPSIAALKAGSQLALANKESVVAGGHLLFSAQVRENQINPVDSDAFRHLAIPALRNPRRSPPSLWSPPPADRSAAGNVLTWRPSLPSRRCIIRRGTWGRLSPSTPPH